MNQISVHRVAKDIKLQRDSRAAKRTKEAETVTLDNRISVGDFREEHPTLQTASLLGGGYVAIACAPMKAKVLMTVPILDA